MKTKKTKKASVKKSESRLNHTVARVAYTTRAAANQLAKKYGRTQTQIYADGIKAIKLLGNSFYEKSSKDLKAALFPQNTTSISGALSSDQVVS